ncbi:nuclease-related domain-containing protein [Virgibacillus alimentarius]|uniref:NERD domain-containing protein n=1 Tax=Virgibacillus alimentarius TaxID=698769 RepID=A0ABS4S8B1_9BACI|nr:nuclease-related domain-containing protein [Virgibacillus alimentarius]MBP2257732.1 hypothetical protein [Virgibacillus alimentarius]
MILKNRTKPIVLEKLDAAIGRLPTNFPALSDMQSEAATRYKGYIGEQKVDYHLEQFAREYTMFQGICLQVDGKTVQFDTVLITKQAIYLIEIKNFSDKITFDTILHQFTRSDGQKETGFRDPLIQAENQKNKLQQWLRAHHLINIPIYYFIAISDPSTIIDVIGDQEAVSKVVAHGEHIPRKIIQKEEVLRKKAPGSFNHSKIGQAILGACKAHDFDILSRYGVKKRHLLTGVHCPACGKLGMERLYGTWQCKACSKRAKLAHLRAFSDYFLLISPWINNKECMRYLRIQSRNVATRLMKTSNMKYQKEYKRWIKADRRRAL